MSRLTASLPAIVCCAIMLSGLARSPVLGQSPQQKQTLQFNSQTPLPLDTMIRYVSDRLKMRFIYTPEIGRRQVILRTPEGVPAAAFYPLFSAALRSANLAIVDSEVPGWKRIIDAGELPLFASADNAARAMQQDGAAAPATMSFHLKYINAQQVSQVIKPFLSRTGSNVLALSDSNVLIVTDYAPAVQMVEKLIRLLDVPARDVTYQFYSVRHMSADTLAKQASAILGEKSGPNAKAGSSVQILTDTHANRVVVVGGTDQTQAAIDLLRQLDVPLGLRTRVYRVRNLSAERLDRLITGLLGPTESENSYESSVDEDGNLLTVRATDEIHRRTAALLRELDRPVEDTESPIQFYKLRNARAMDVLSTLLALQEAYGLGTYQPGASLQSPLGGGGFFPAQGLSPGFSPFAATGAAQGQMPGTVRGVNTTGANQFRQMPPGVENTASTPNRQRANERELAALPLTGQAGLAPGGLQSAAILPGGARVSADVGTNSLIVVAPAGVQQMYANLIKSLDQRRPQVLIEAKIIAIDTSDDFALGVEVSTGDRSGTDRLFKFTSFGLSEVDPTTGALQITPAIGFNGTLVDPEVADVVVQALASNTRARVLSVPKVLVNDNTTGSLESVVSIPFQSVNASDTVSTTSLGGNQSAGTIVTVTPHINEDDNLQLEFDVEFSTFTGTSSNGLPPPRQVDRVGSTVTIPDGRTVIVGGLKRHGSSDSFAGVPWIEKIPVLRELSSRTTERHTSTSFFLFIRPVILRDSRFGDLRFVSSQEQRRAGIPAQYPSSGPVIMR